MVRLSMTSKSIQKLVGRQSLPHSEGSALQRESSLMDQLVYGIDGIYGSLSVMKWSRT